MAISMLSFSAGTVMEEEHLCKKQAALTLDEGCCSEGEEMPCCSDSEGCADEGHGAKHCCEAVVMTFYGEEAHPEQTITVRIAEQAVAKVAVAVPYALCFQAVSRKEVSLLRYLPPPLTSDIPVLVQQFRI